MSDRRSGRPSRRTLPRRTIGLLGAAVGGGFRLLARLIMVPDAALTRAVRARRDGVMVEFRSQVHKLLPDDSLDPPHQRFLIRLSSGGTVLIAHNLVLAKRVPAREGDRVRIKGEYQWNQKGGVIHWTHHDPRGSHPHGWIRHRGRQYG